MRVSLKVIKYKYSKIKKMKENILYEPPQVEVIEVEVESGFAVSNGYPIGGTVVEDDMRQTGGGVLPWSFAVYSFHLSV